MDDRNERESALENLRDAANEAGLKGGSGSSPGPGGRMTGEEEDRLLGKERGGSGRINEELRVDQDQDATLPVRGRG